MAVEKSDTVMGAPTSSGERQSVWGRGRDDELRTKRRGNTRLRRKDKEAVIRRY
jgi:hypothetical protein